MTPAMRKRRIAYLWGKARTAVKVKTIFDQVESKAIHKGIDNFGLDSDVEYFLPDNQ